jgi:hypothetical protein
MRVLYAIILGGGAAIGSILLHQTLPPVGVAIGILGSVITIWWVGRYTGARRFKVLAFAVWTSLIFRAGTFGVGQELLVQADSPGSALLLIGFFATLAAVFARV